jgi:Tol biopolymer transport system component
MTARIRHIRPTRRTATFGGILLAALLAVSARAQVNGKLAFTREPYDTFTNNNIWVKDLDAGTTTMVTDDGAMDYEAKWTRDGKRLAFRSLARSPHTGTSIWVKELASGSITPATNDTANDFMPGWAPGGDQIAFSTTVRGGGTTNMVFTVDLGTGAYTQATDDAAHDNYPAWSTDGTTIAFESASRPPSTSMSIWLLDVVSGDMTQLTDDDGDDGEPVWSFDGSRVAFSSTARGGTTGECIWIIDVATLALEQLTDDTVADDRPSWSPDGSQIAFRSASRGTTTTRSIWTVDVATQAVTLISDDLTNDDSPAFFAEAVTKITAQSTDGLKGGVVTVDIDAGSLLGLDVSAIDLILTYDTSILTPVVTTPVAAGPGIPVDWEVFTNESVPGTMNIALAGQFDNGAAGNGALASITFNIDGAAVGGSTSPLTLTKASLNEGARISEIVDGTFTVVDLMYGDVTGNGEISAYDASWILECVAQALVDPLIVWDFPVQSITPPWAPVPLSPATAALVADVQGNGAITAMDASLVLQRAVLLISQFPVEAVAAPGLTATMPAYRWDVSADHLRPGETVTLTLDPNEDILAGELLLEYNPKLLRVVGVSVASGDDDAPPLIARQDADGKLALAFASAKPIVSDRLVTVTLEATRNVARDSDGIVRARHLRLNGATAEMGLAHSLTVRPYAFRAMANYPNPFNPETWIPFELGEQSQVVIRIYDPAGRRVRTLDLGTLPTGEYTTNSDAAHWDGKNERGEAVTSGVYVYEIEAGDQHALRRMVVLK